MANELAGLDAAMAHDAATYGIVQGDAPGRWVILVRNPLSGDIRAIETSHDGFGKILVYFSEAHATRAANTVPLCRAWPWRVVEAP